MQRTAAAAIAAGVMLGGCSPPFPNLLGTATPVPVHQTSDGVQLAVDLPADFAGEVVFSARELYEPGEDFTIVALPDTQYYSESYPETFAAQTQWIVDNRDALNIVAVLHLGDIVDNADQPAQWAAADAAIRILETEPNLPFGLAVGNHDQHPNGNPAGTEAFNRHFPVERFSRRMWYGGHFGADNDNHHILFSGGGLDFIAVFMEFDRGGDAETLAWADSLLKQHRARNAIVVTHFALTSHLLDSKFSPQGRAIRDALTDNPNLFLTLGGHFCGVGRRTDTYKSATVHSVLADYQCRPEGGQGFLRLIHVSPSARTMHFRTYSPTRDEYLVNAKQDFVLPMNIALDGEFDEVGRATPDENGRASIEWTCCVQAGKTYEWRVESEGGVVLGGPWVFTTP